MLHDRSPRMLLKQLLTVAFVPVLFGCGGCQPPTSDVPSAGSSAATGDLAGNSTDTVEQGKEIAVAELFDGVSLGHWEPVQFGGEGLVSVENGELRLGMGGPLTGVVWRGPEPPRTNYALYLEAMKVEGNDFFCCLTFPVAESHCSLVLGGWGGAVVGLSSIDGQDAARNETTTMMGFEKGQWYAIRVSVDEDRIVVSLDDKEIINHRIEGHEFSIRGDVDLTTPLGLATFETTGCFRKIQLIEPVGKREVRE